MKKFSKFVVEKKITKDIFDFVGEKGEKVYDTMMKVAKKNKIKVMKPKNQSKARMGGDHIQISGDENAVNDLIKKYVGEDAKKFATADKMQYKDTNMKNAPASKESTMAYGRAMVKKQRDQKKAMITKKDKSRLGKLAKLMAKQPKRKT